MQKSSYVEYFKTAMITLLVVIIISASTMIYARLHVGETVSDDEVALQNDMIGYLITKYKHQEQSSPKNAVVNLKLGQLYEMLESYNQAEHEYLTALEKRAGRYETASFRLAGVYLLKKQYGNAESIMEKIPDSSRYSVFVEKGKFYKSYGDALFNDGDFEGAVKKYDKAMVYLRKINNSYKQETQEAQIDAYIALADQYVSEGKTNKALDILNYAQENSNSPIIRYKLGLLYLDGESEKAVDMFESVLKDAPSIINFSIYKKLLFSLKLQFEYSGDALKSKLYDTKLSRLRSYMQRNVLLPEEIIFAGYKLNVKSFPVRNEYDFIYSFDITNITNQNIPKLYAIVEFYDAKGNLVYTYTESIAKSFGGIDAGSGIIPVKFVIKTKKNLIQRYEKIPYKLYLSKNPKVLKLLYINDSIDVTKGKKTK